MKNNKLFYLYDDENQFLIDPKTYEVIPKDNIVYKILEKYKPPKFLKNIKVIVYNSIEEADRSLIYIGIDKNNKEQYVYGSEFVKLRNKKRLSIYLKIDEMRPYLHKFIEKTLKHIYKSLTIDIIFCIILLLELKFFIRTGKKEYYDMNRTTGLLSLKKENFIVEEDQVIIKFNGKKKINHVFYVEKNSEPELYLYLKILHVKCNDNDLIF